MQISLFRDSRDIGVHVSKSPSSTLTSLHSMFTSMMHKSRNLIGRISGTLYNSAFLVHVVAFPTLLRVRCGTARSVFRNFLLEDLPSSWFLSPWLASACDRRLILKIGWGKICGSQKFYSMSSLVWKCSRAVFSSPLTDVFGQISQYGLQ